jgi:hypothetical protein
MKKLQYYLVTAYVAFGNLERKVVHMQSFSKWQVQRLNRGFARKKKSLIWRLPTEIFGEIKPS